MPNVVPLPVKTTAVSSSTALTLTFWFNYYKFCHDLLVKSDAVGSQNFKLAESALKSFGVDFCSLDIPDINKIKYINCVYSLFSHIFRNTSAVSREYLRENLIRISMTASVDVINGKSITHHTVCVQVRTRLSSLIAQIVLDYSFSDSVNSLSFVLNDYIHDTFKCTNNKAAVCAFLSTLSD